VIVAETDITNLVQNFYQIMYQPNYNLFVIVILFLVTSFSGLAQEPSTFTSSIVIGNSDAASSVAGTIRYNAEINDFEGWNGQEWLSLTGKSFFGQIPDGSIADVDGNIYPTKIIGDQEWMMKNLRVSRYNDLTMIPNHQDSAQWRDEWDTGAWCSYNNDPSSDEVYGKLYNRFAQDMTTICPSGWEVPNSSDWGELFNHLGGQAVSGGLMKTTGTFLWSTPNSGATNTSSFSAVPIGIRTPNDQFIEQSLSSEYRNTDVCTRIVGAPNTCTSYKLSYDNSEVLNSSLKDDVGAPYRNIAAS